MIIKIFQDCSSFFCWLHWSPLCEIWDYADYDEETTPEESSSSNSTCRLNWSFLCEIWDYAYDTETTPENGPRKPHKKKKSRTKTTTPTPPPKATTPIPPPESTTSIPLEISQESDQQAIAINRVGNSLINVAEPSQNGTKKSNKSTKPTNSNYNIIIFQ